jgi:hypothetical protein
MNIKSTSLIQIFTDDRLDGSHVDWLLGRQEASSKVRGGGAEFNVALCWLHAVKALRLVGLLIKK